MRLRCPANALLLGGLLSSFLAGGISLSAQQPAGERGVTKAPAAKEATAAPPRSYYALVIGIDAYKKLSPLRTAVGDAQAVAKILSDDYGFKVKLLVDVSRQEILDALNEYRRDLDSNANLLIYYAGHGYDDKVVNKAYWLPVDADKDKNTNWIQSDDITSDLKAIPASHILVVSDSCYSGQMRDASISFAPRVQERYLEKMLAGRSRTLMASGGDEPVSDSGGSGHSVFAAALIRALTNTPEKVFSAEDLFQQYILHAVAGNAEQTPQYEKLRNSGHLSGDFVFARKGVALPAVTLGAGDDLGRVDSERPAEANGIGFVSSTPLGGMSAVKTAIVSLDMDSLKNLTAGKVAPAVFEQAFRQLAADGKTTVAQQFFESSLDSPEAMEWFDAELAAGMDPNMTVPSDYYEREGILIAATRAGNFRAVKALLRRGASPHAYQDLFLTRYTVPRFLFPLQSLVAEARLSMAEKQELTKVFIDAGVVIPEPLPAGDYSSTEMHEAADLRDQFATKLGMHLLPSAVCCKEPSTICKRLSSRGGTNWCDVVNAMPNKLTFASTPGKDSPFYDLRLRYLLGVDRNIAYFLGLIAFPNRAFGPEYVLVGVSKDASSWTVFKYMSPDAGMGLCKKDDKSDDGPRPEWCWRAVSLYRVAETNKMRNDHFGITWNIEKEP